MPKIYSILTLDHAHLGFITLTPGPRALLKALRAYSPAFDCVHHTILLHNNIRQALTKDGAPVCYIVPSLKRDAH